MRNKRGTTLLIENIIFIILNLVFIAILVFFLLSRSGNASVLQEKYAKEIALLLDSAKPEMIISLDMEDAINLAVNNLGEDRLNEVVDITGNIVTVKLKENGAYSYSFFSNLSSIDCYPFNTKEYVFVVGGYDEQKRC